MKVTLMILTVLVQQCVYELSPRFLRQSWQIEDGGRTGWLVAMQNAWHPYQWSLDRTFSSFSLRSFCSTKPGCAASGFTAVFVKRDKRRHAAPLPACFEVWKGGSSSQFLSFFFFFSSQFLRCTGGGGFWRRSGGVTGSTWRFSAGWKLQGSEHYVTVGDGRICPSLLKTEGSYSVPCGNSRS